VRDAEGRAQKEELNSDILYISKSFLGPGRFYFLDCADPVSELSSTSLLPSASMAIQCIQ
jgi:hypothetical protein